MTTKQSNKQTQNVKVVVNNNVKSCCDDKPKRRRKPTPKPPPPEEPAMPTPVMQPWAKGLPAQGVRPMIYAPQTTMIQPENGLSGIPPYFERQFTNQQAALDDMRQALREQFNSLHDELAVQYVNNSHLQNIAKGVEKLHKEALGEVQNVVGTPQQTPVGTPLSSITPQSSIQSPTAYNNPLYEATALRPLKIPQSTPQAPQIPDMIQFSPTPQASQIPDMILFSPTPQARPPPQQYDNVNPFTELNPLNPLNPEMAGQFIAPPPITRLRPLIIPPEPEPEPAQPIQPIQPIQPQQNQVAEGIAPQVNLFEALAQQQSQPAAAMDEIQRLDALRLAARAKNQRRREDYYAKRIREITDRYNIPSHHHISGLTNLFAQQYGL